MIFDAVKLGDICEFQNGRGFKKTEWRTAGLPIIRIQNLNNADAKFNYFDGVYDPRIEVNDGDLLFSWSGTVGSSFGPHLWNRGKGVLNQHIFKVALREDVDKAYAFYALKEITAEIEKSVSGAVGLVHVTKRSLIEFEIPLPPLSEQRRIVSVLDAAFAGLATAEANTRQNLTNARELFHERLNSLTELASCDADEALLEEVLAVQPRNGWSPPKKFQTGNGVPVLTLSSVTGFVFDMTRVTMSSAPTQPDAHYWLKEGELLVTRSNTPQLVGHVAIARGVDCQMIVPDLIMKMTVDQTKTDTRFLWYWLRTNRLRDTIVSRATGASSTMKKIGKKVVQSLPVPVISVREQEAVSQKLDALSLGIDQLEVIQRSKLAAIATLKQSLLHRAFRGELAGDGPPVQNEAMEIAGA